jgi:D-beta-D-heptose 7-phosphate kinase / D-beta-D-heptose 1-phosphate adenosyltransferase
MSPLPSILVIGDIITDEYYDVSWVHPSPEHDGVCLGNSNLTSVECGGAANVAANIASMGFPVVLSGITGCRRVVSAIGAYRNIVNACVTDSTAPTCTKSRYYYRGTLQVRHDTEDSPSAYKAFHEELFKTVAPYLDKVHTVVVSDYAKGTLGEPLLEAINHASPDVWVIDPKRTLYSSYNHPNAVIKPNAMEAMAITGAYDAAGATRQLAARLGCRIMVTCGRDGIWHVDKHGFPQHSPCHPSTPKSVVGAGDTAAAVLAAGLSVGIDFTSVVDLCLKACAYVISQPRTTVLPLDVWKNLIEVNSLEHL